MADAETPEAAPQASSAEAIPIVFDTSVLKPVDPGSPPPEFMLLQRLAAADKVRLLLPEMVREEWLCHRLESPLHVIKVLGKCVQDLGRHPGIRSQAVAPSILESASLTPEALRDLSAALRDWTKEAMNRGRFQLIPFELSDLKVVVEWYFTGKGPFESARARKDIPDGLVCAGAFRVLSQDPKGIFVCNDKRAREAAAAEGFRVAESITELLRHEDIRALHSNPTFALWWEEHFDEVVERLRHIAADLDETVFELARDKLIDSTVRHHNIPEDNSEAVIRDADSFHDLQIRWDTVESLGEGLLSVNVEFACQIQLDFMVYRGDAFDVPAWVQVSLGDFEEDHYFDAQGYAEATFPSRLVFEFAPDVMEDLEFDGESFVASLEDIELDSLEC